MTRTYVVTGSASGIGAATAALLRSQGHRVIGVDVSPGADVVADLSTVEGRAAMVDAVTTACGGTLDAVIANAGTSSSTPLDVSVNYFGAVATLVGLRALLAASAAPRAVATCSSSIHLSVEASIVDACLAGDEAGARAAAASAGMLTYPSTKRALARWLRAVAPSAEWAGAGIALNGIAPGIVETPMTAAAHTDPAIAELFDAAVPMPLGGHAQPEEIAHVIAFLAAAETTKITGQVLFIDGGADTINRPGDIWA